MRLPLLTTIILLSGLFTIATARIQNDPSQGVQPVTLMRVRGQQEPPGATTTGDASKQTATRATTSGNAHSSSTATAETASSSTTTSLSGTNTMSNGTKNESSKADELPLKPSLTPAMGVGGFILIALGAVLALVGSRNLRAQVFLSTGFLASLGVAVLIIYVMSPPVTNAVQGAYLVAVFFTGLTFGALAIVFRELTEGLGCLLGGFCFSMWLMALKPGGLLTETSSKIGFIAAITVGGYAFSFSQYTRTYGLIISTAFSGGTALSLGIDCFSRAGLKEFWLYIWDLNDKTFPRDTSTYPMNRNIRVELAVTVIVTLMGVVSQLRLWKMIRQRRRDDAKVREEEKRKNGDAELEAARQLEENNIRERAEWEARYGDGDSHFQNHGKSKAMSVQELPVEEHEIHEKAAGLESSENVNIATPSGHSYRCEDCKTREANGEVLYIASETASQASDENPQSHDSEPEHTAGQTQPPLFSGAKAASADHDDDQSTVSAVIDSEMGTMRSVAYSRAPLDQGNWPQERNTLIRACDRASGASTSSAEGVADDGSVLDSHRSSMESAEDHSHGTPVTERDITEQIEKMEDSPKQDPDETQGIDLGTQKPEHSFVELIPKETTGIQRHRANEIPLDDAPQSPKTGPLHAEHEDTPIAGEQQPPSPKTKTEPNSKRASLNEDTVKDLPQRASRIVQSYRTNEWAKHLDDAEIPEPPPIQPIEEEQPKIPAEEATGKQPVAPLIVNELLQTPLNAQPPPAIERKEQRKSNSPPRVSHELQSKQTDTAPPKDHDNGSLRPKWKGPPPLLAVREDLVRYKPSSTSVSIDPWLRFRNNPRNLNIICSTRTIPEEEADDLPLSQRRAMLQAQSSPGANSVISRNLPSPGARDSNAQATMAAWRNSVREDLWGRRNPLGSSVSNSSLPAERTSSSSFSTSPFAFGQSPRDRTSAMTLHIENKIATSMQKGDMHDLHRDAIRRLQASATRRA